MKHQYDASLGRLKELVEEDTPNEVQAVENEN
jgi:hypothetical protein